MSHQHSRKSRIPLGAWAGAILTALAALVIGCGGGGGGDTTTSTNALTSATATASATATSTASSSTASNSTASSSTASTSGVLPPNVIFYSDSPDQANGSTVTNYNYISPTGGSNVQVASLSTNFGGIAINSVNQTKYFAYTADPNNPSYGIYSNTTYNATGATTIVAPNAVNPYVYVGELQLSPDGTTLYFLGAVGENEPQIFSVPAAGGVAPTALDFALDTFNLNQAGNQLVYGKVINNTTQIFTRGIAATSTPVQITNNASFSSDEPQWNKAGTQIAFTANPPNGTGLDYVFVMNPDGSGVTQVTNTANQDDHTPSFNASPSTNTAGTQLSFVSFSGGSTATQGLYTVTLPGSSGKTDVGRTLVQPDPAILTGTYWTSALGRGPAKLWGFLAHWRKNHPVGARKAAPEATVKKPAK